MVYAFWTHSPISMYHKYFWCMFLTINPKIGCVIKKSNRIRPTWHVPYPHLSSAWHHGGLLALPTKVSQLGQMTFWLTIPNLASSRNSKFAHTTSWLWMRVHHDFSLSLSLFCKHRPSGRAPKCMTYKMRPPSYSLMCSINTFKLHLLRRDSTCNLIESSNPKTLSQLACQRS